MIKKLVLGLLICVPAICAHAQSVSMIGLLADTCAYNHKEISVTAFLAYTQPKTPDSTVRLYLLPSDFEYMNFRQSVLVKMPKELFIRREEFDKKYVSVTGVYDCSIVAHGILGAGGFSSVTQVAHASRNPNADPIGFENFSVEIDIGKGSLGKYGEVFRSALQAAKEGRFEDLAKFFIDPARVSSELQNENSRLRWTLVTAPYSFSTFDLDALPIAAFRSTMSQIEPGVLVCFSRGKKLDRRAAGRLRTSDWRAEHDRFCVLFEGNGAAVRIDELSFE